MPISVEFWSNGNVVCLLRRSLKDTKSCYVVLCSEHAEMFAGMSHCITGMAPGREALTSTYSNSKHRFFTIYEVSVNHL